MDNNLRIYIHVPFCKSKCNYCDFCSFADKDYMIQPYFEALTTEIGLYKNDYRGRRIDSIFIGGGTPSYVDTKYIQYLLSCFDIDRDAEITIEVNPGTVDFHTLRAYREMGINRISFGVQSFSDRMLMLMGRIHNRATAINNIHESQVAGFENINVDLIFGYPDQSYECYAESLNVVKSLKIPHVSCYSLSIEENTPLSGMLKKGLLQYPNEDLDRDMYALTIDSLGKSGIYQYEISNFAQPGYECRHNIGYWIRDEYLGFGLNSHSLLNECRYSNKNLLNDYISILNKCEKPVKESNMLTDTEIISEYIILRLRMNRGLDINDFKTRFSIDFEERYGSQIDDLQNKGLLEKIIYSYRLTRKGMDLANKVFVEFI